MTCVTEGPREEKLYYVVMLQSYLVTDVSSQDNMSYINSAKSLFSKTPCTPLMNTDSRSKV
jgi:hypothetical protein